MRPHTSQIDQPYLPSNLSSPFFSVHCRKTVGILDKGSSVRVLLNGNSPTVTGFSYPPSLPLSDVVSAPNACLPPLGLEYQDTSHGRNFPSQRATWFPWRLISHTRNKSVSPT